MCVPYLFWSKVNFAPILFRDRTLPKSRYTCTQPSIRIYNTYIHPIFSGNSST